MMAVMPQAAQALPDTAQGKRVQIYVDAFNAGDESAFLAMMKDQVDPQLIAKRTDDERKQMFQRMRGDFGTFKIARVERASASEIVVAIPNKNGIEAQFTFTFQEAAPHKISGISVEIDRGGL
jgi:hypothetical protein